ncbi:MAG: glycosyltransferase family 4 protein [Candidatus Thorarchaeota archaeon]
MNNLVRLGKHLSSKGHELVILTSPPRYPSEIQKHSWARICFVTPSGSFMGFRYIVSYMIGVLIASFRLKRSFKPDLVHGHSAYPVFGLLLQLTSRILNRPSLFTLYSPIQTGEFLEGFMKYLQSSFLVRNLFLHGLLIVPTSKAVRKSCQAISIRCSMEIYPIIDFEMFAPLSNQKRDMNRRKMGLNSQDIAITYLGNLRRTKGLIDLLKALNILVSKFRVLNIQLLLALDIPREKYAMHRELQENLISTGLISKTIPLGITPDIGVVLASTDVVVIPFLNTFGPADPPLSVLEAMAAGTTVVTTSVGGIPEFISNGVNGILVPPKRPEELADRLHEIIKMPSKLEKISQNAPTKILQHCKASIAGSRYLQLYNVITGASINE